MKDKGRNVKEGKEFDLMFKIVIIGDTSVGKSSLLVRFSDDQFSDTYVTTIGVDFVRFKLIKIEV